MRGANILTESLFMIRRLENFIAADHPLRAACALVNKAQVKMHRLFSKMYKAENKSGRLSIAPKKLFRAMLLLDLYVHKH